MIAVCRGAAKAEALKRLGADEVIDQSADSEPLRSQVKVPPGTCPLDMNTGAEMWLVPYAS